MKRALLICAVEWLVCLSVCLHAWVWCKLCVCVYVQRGETALHVAALSHKSKVARLLVDAGCSCKLKNKVSTTTCCTFVIFARFFDMDLIICDQTSEVIKWIELIHTSRTKLILYCLSWFLDCRCVLLSAWWDCVAACREITLWRRC